MEYFSEIQAVISFIERRLRVGIDFEELRQATGFSGPHLRKVFKDCTTVPLARYINGRRVSHAAYEIIHTQDNITEIAMNYGFDSYDTFTRAFKRFTGVNPVEFRKKRCHVGRTKLSMGIYGPSVCEWTSEREVMMEGINRMNEIKRTEQSCILYGVAQVKYCWEECTPFPSALRACLNYMGHDISYAYLMAATGAAFRLRWYQDLSFFHGGNVDVMYIYEDPKEVYIRGFKAVGRSCTILERRPGVTKEDFIKVIKEEINQGRPLIALGIIGPPEACIITGYQEDGNTLLGWNFFQDNPEFAKDVAFDETGYFICNTWWENPNTLMLMTIGEEEATVPTAREIVANGLDIMTKEKVKEHFSGQSAYDAYASAMENDINFPKDAVLPLLFERMMCMTDACTMISEGRAYAACYLREVAKQKPQIETELLQVAGIFDEMFCIGQDMFKLLDQPNHEDNARKLAEKETRLKLVALIRKAQATEKRVCDTLTTIVDQLD